MTAEELAALQAAGITAPPQVAVPAAVTPAPVAAPPPVAPVAATPATPDWLPARLEQAKRAAQLETAKQLGFESIEEAEAFTKRAREAAEAAKSADQKPAVRQIAGDDPSLRLRAISALQSVWQNTAPRTVAPAVSSAPPSAAPAPAGSADGGPGVVAVDHAAEYQRLRTVNPIAAAHYLDRN